MPESEPQSGEDVTARLVEELTRTNQRLERLEAALAERSMLPQIQQTPEHVDTPAGAQIGTEAPGAETANGVNAGSAEQVAEEADAHFRRGVALCQAGDYDEAMSAWQEVLNLQPDNSFALANIAIVLTEQGRWAEARQRFVRVLELQPDSAEAYYGLGMADAQMGNYAGAIAAWENTIRLQPDNTDAHYNMALVRQRLGQQGGLRPADSPETAAGTSAPATAGTGAAKPGSNGATSLEPSAGKSGTELAAENGAGQTQENSEEAHEASEDSEAEDEEADLTPVSPRTPLPPRDWKRVDGKAGSRGSQAARGASRLSRPPSSRSGRSPAGLLLAVGLVVACAYTINHFWQANKAGKLAPANSGTFAARPAAVPAPGGGNGARTGGTGAAIGSGGSATGSGTSRTSVAPAIVSGRDLDSSANETPAGPPHPGRMQIRLAEGLKGQYRYWFVSGANHAAAMRWLPRANRSGLIAMWVPAEYNGPGAQLRILDVKQGKVARLPISDVTRTTPIRTPNVGPNLLQNADFSQGTKGWSMENTAPGHSTMRVDDSLSTVAGVTGRPVHFDVTAVGKQGWNVQCYQMGVDLKDQDPYILSFWAKSDRKRPLHVDAILDRADWHPVGLGVAVILGTTWQKYMVPFTATHAEPSHTRISFILGESLGPVDICGISLRRREGAVRTVVLTPDAAVTVSGRDFN